MRPTALLQQTPSERDRQLDAYWFRLLYPPEPDVTAAAVPAIATRRVLTCEVLGHPHPQQRPRAGINKHTGKAQMFDPAVNRAAARIVRDEVLRAARDASFPLPMTGPVELRVAFYGRGPMGDTDNLVKCVLDALNTVVLVDDKQIDRIRARRHWGKEACPNKADEKTLVCLIENPDSED